MAARLLTLLRGVLLGWATLFSLIFALERPLLNLIAARLGPAWLPIANQSLDCLALAAAGWVTGRSNRESPLLTVLLFAGTLTLWDFGEALSINVPWLVRLTVDAFGDSRYFESLVSAAGNQALLFGSLIAGGLLSRPRRPMLRLGTSATINSSQ
jgi:hypothetical protein